MLDGGSQLVVIHTSIASHVEREPVHSSPGIRKGIQCKTIDMFLVQALQKEVL